MIVDILIYIFLFLIVILNTYFSMLSKVKIYSADVINYVEDLSIDGINKMKLAVEKTKDVIPFIFKILFTESKIETIIQETFDKMECYSKKQMNGEGKKNGS